MFSYKDTVILLQDITQALEELKILGILHKNIDMNLIYFGRAAFKLGGYEFCDFCFQSRLSEKGYQYFTNLTKSVMSLNPEITLNRVCNNKTPLFGVGVVLYWLFHKDYPFKASNAKELAVKYQSKDTWVACDPAIVPKPLENLINGLLQVNYIDRLSPSELLLISKRLYNELFMSEIEAMKVKDKLFFTSIKEKEKTKREKKGLLEKVLKVSKVSKNSSILPPIRSNQPIVSCMASFMSSPPKNQSIDGRKNDKSGKLASLKVVTRSRDAKVFDKITASDFDLRHISPRLAASKKRKNSSLSNLSLSTHNLHFPDARTKNFFGNLNDSLI